MSGLGLRVLPYGDEAVLVEVADGAAVAAMHAALRAAAAPGMLAMVPAARTLLVRLDPAVLTAADAAAAVHAVARHAATVHHAADPTALRGTSSTVGGSVGGSVGGPGGDPDRPVVEVPVVYDGPDLAHVAACTGLGTREVVERHGAGTYVVAFCGFMPGFAYLTGLDPLLQVPRRPSPRVRVPRGSVAVAGEYTAVYPRSSPGGWNLLGRSDIPLFDVDRDPPALLPPGTRVRFLAVRG